MAEMDDPKALTPTQRAELLTAQARFLQRKAGQMDQHERARLGIPPRTFLRAAANVSKTGRKGAKARARILREARRRGM